MSSQSITLDLPERLYQAANRLAQATQRPLSEILQETLAHSLPPLDDVSPEEADLLARMSGLDDAALWRASRAMMTEEQQSELSFLLDAQAAGEITLDETKRLQALIDEYEPAGTFEQKVTVLNWRISPTMAVTRRRESPWLF